MNQTLGLDEAYCTGCGKPRPIVVGQWPGIDPRYTTVQCGRVKRPGMFDRGAARRIIKARRARAKVIRAHSKAEQATIE